MSEVLAERLGALRQVTEDEARHAERYLRRVALDDADLALLGQALGLYSAAGHVSRRRAGGRSPLPVYRPGALA